MGHIVWLENETVLGSVAQIQELQQLSRHWRSKEASRRHGLHRRASRVRRLKGLFDKISGSGVRMPFH